MGREIILLHFGQAGVQLGSALWELFCAEHRLNPDGQIYMNQDGALMADFEHMDAFFYEGWKSWSPRAVMIDLEPTVIDEIRTGCYRRLWRPTCLITGTEDASNNYGRGNCTIGRLKLEETLDSIRKLAEDSKGLSAFEIVHSHSGGTGSGMTSLVLEHLCDEYGKTFKFTTSVFPSPTYSQSTVDPYNSVLHTNTTIENTDCAILFDNQTMFNRCTQELAITHPSYTDINRLLSQMLSSVFLAHRFNFGGSQQACTLELLTNLIPYPRIHFQSLSFAPLQPRWAGEHDSLSIAELTRAVFGENAKTLDFPCTLNRYISCALLYRGSCSTKPIYEALQIVKGSRTVGANFVDWCPTGFKIGLSPFPPTVLPATPLVYSPRSVCMLAGNLGIRYAWRRNSSKFDVLFSRRSFVHWFVGEGIEESEFAEARENLAILEQDYEALTFETVSEMADVVEYGREQHSSSQPREKSIEVSKSADSVSARSQGITKSELTNSQSSGMHSNNANKLRVSQLFTEPHTIRSKPSGDMGLTEWTIPTDRSGTVVRSSNLYSASGVRGDPVNQRHQHHNRRHHHQYHLPPQQQQQQQQNRFAYQNQPSDNGTTNYTPRGDKQPTIYDQAAHHHSLGDNYSPEALRSTELVSSVSEVRTTELSRPTLPRGRNMNHPRHSQLNTDTGFLPTVPLIQTFRTDDACTERATPFFSMLTSTAYPSRPVTPTSEAVRVLSSEAKLVPNLPTGLSGTCRHGPYRARRQRHNRLGLMMNPCQRMAQVDEEQQQQRTNPDISSQVRGSAETESSTSGFESMSSVVSANEDAELLTEQEDLQCHISSRTIVEDSAWSETTHSLQNHRSLARPMQKHCHTHAKHKCRDHHQRHKSRRQPHTNPYVHSKEQSTELA